MKETISDMIDQRPDWGDESAELTRIAGDPDGCRVWRNYHLIGAVIRGEVKGAGPCLVDRVQLALKSEPEIQYSRFGINRWGSSPDLAARSRFVVSSMSSKVLPAAGLFSLAASMMLFAVISFVPRPDLPERASLASRAVEADSGVTTSSTIPEAGLSEPFQAEFGQMLTGHGEFAGTPTLNGLAAYAKFVMNQPLAK